MGSCAATRIKCVTVDIPLKPEIILFTTDEANRLSGDTLEKVARIIATNHAHITRIEMAVNEHNKKCTE